MKLLFICYENIVRSRTAQAIYSKDKRFTCRSAGLSPESEVVLTRELMDWADRIFVMEEDIAETICHKFPSAAYREFIVLDIYDYYHFMQPELVKKIREKVSSFLEDVD